MNSMQTWALQFKTAVADIANLDSNLSLVKVFESTDPTKVKQLSDNAYSQMRIYGT